MNQSIKTSVRLALLFSVLSLIALVVPLATGAREVSAVERQENRIQVVSPTNTGTPTTTLTSTTTPTGSLTVSITSTSTGTGAGTQTATPSTTVLGTSTSTLPVTSTVTPSHTPFLTPTDTITPIVTPTIEGQESPEIPAPIPLTATLIPFPTITMLFPGVIETPNFLSAERIPELPALVKQGSEPAFKRVLRLWPFVILLIIWFILGVWFVFTQRQMD